LIIVPKPEVKLVYVGTYKVGKNWFIRGEISVLEYAIRYSSLSGETVEIELLSYDDYSTITRLIRRRIGPALGSMERMRVKLGTGVLPVGLYLVRVRIGDRVYVANTGPRYNYENRFSSKLPPLRRLAGISVVMMDLFWSYVEKHPQEI